MMVRIEPRTGPAQGVQTRPSVVPGTKAPMLPWRDGVLAPELPWMSPLIRIDSHSNGAGQTISTPKASSRMAAPVRSTLGSKSKMRVIALSNKAAAENDSTNPSAINVGRAFPVWPTDAPSRIGSIGSVQGAATVTTPASSARTRLNIERDPLNGRPCGRPRALRSFGKPGRSVTPAASRVREGKFNLNAGRPQTQSDPEGG